MGCAAPNPFHWEDLRNRPQDEILGKRGVAPAAGGPGYEVTFLNARYRVDPVAESVHEIEPRAGRALAKSFQILLIGYLLVESAPQLAGNTITEKELPGGPTFFRGPHELPVGPIAERFGDDPDGFESRGIELGGERAEHGDRAVRLWPFAEIPVTLILWLADDEFPASVTTLFDASLAGWLSLDMVFLLMGAVTERFVEQ